MKGYIFFSLPLSLFLDHLVVFFNSIFFFPHSSFIAFFDIIVTSAEVAELEDARDLKSLGGIPPCGFESRLRHKTGSSSVGLECALWEREVPGSSPGSPTKLGF